MCANVKRPCDYMYDVCNPGPRDGTGSSHVAMTALLHYEVVDIKAG